MLERLEIFLSGERQQTCLLIHSDLRPPGPRSSPEMARRASVDRRGSVGCVPRNVRRDVEVAQIVDELAYIVSLIGAEREAP